MRCLGIFLSLVLYPCFNNAEFTLTPEQMYHRASFDYRSRMSYEPWLEFFTEMSAILKAGETDLLEIIASYEESILVIEQETKNEGQNPPRDEALSLLYFGYAQTLLGLTALECKKLAMDPYTLLIGADTVSEDSDPSSNLCQSHAENSLRNAVTLDATNSEAADRLEEVLGGQGSVHERKPLDFVAELFDSFADTFDEKLGSLEYKVPQIVGTAAKAFKPSYKAVMDAGCGTGLAGRFLRPLVSNVMVGVDASQNMLLKAAKCTLSSGCGLPEEDEPTESKRLYDALFLMDLEEMDLQSTLHSRTVLKDAKVLENSTIPSAFDLVVAADVLVYFGDLKKIVKKFAEISSDGAGLIFSCERTTDTEAPLGYRLLPSGRFAHTKQHAVEVASEAGYSLVTYEKIVPRMEKGEPVKGHLFVFELTNGKSDEL